MALTVGQRVRHPAKPEWGLGEVLEVQDQKILVEFEHAGRRLLKSVALTEITTTNSTNSKRVRRNVKRSTKKNTVKTKRGSKEVIDDRSALPVTVFGYSEPSISPEFETTLKVLDRLRQDFGPAAEANTALLLYTLLQ